MTPEESALLRAINALRRKHRLPTLMPHPKLHVIARQQSMFMRDRRYFDHRHFETRIGTEWEAASENIAYADLGAGKPEEIVEMWEKSARHRKNMLGDFLYIGVGRMANEKGAWWTTDYAR